MAEFADAKIKAYAGPAAPDELEPAIGDFIAGARSSLDIAVQELDAAPIAEAILDASWRNTLAVARLLLCQADRDSAIGKVRNFHLSQD